MLGISDAHVIDQQHEGEGIPDEIDGVRLRYNQTDPTVLRDGVNTITVADDGQEYRILFWGYVAGLLRVQPEGVAELGKSLFTDLDSDLPRWLIDSDSITGGELPWWIPDAVDLDPHVRCQQCRERTPAGLVVAPGSFDDRMSSERFCEACWNERSPEPY